MKTKRSIEYKAAPYGTVAVIPAGTRVIPATNLPGSGQFWAMGWRGMTDTERSWHRNYGYLLTQEDVNGLN